MKRVIVIWIGLLMALPMAAQEFRATLTGRVTDPSGAAIAGAQVTAVQRETNAATRGVSTDAGNYVIPFLPPGEYRIEVENPGFKKFVREGIRLQIQDRFSLDVVLQIGELAETVTVSGSTTQIETASASMGEVVSQRTIVDMPMNGRNPFRLTTLVPGTIATGRATNLFLSRYTATGGSGVGETSISGGTNGYNEWLLDGVSVTGNNNMLNYIPSVDATQEFKVQTNAFDAEFGRFLGGVVSATIKSGTNEFHGALVAFHRNSAFNARDFFATSKPAFQFTQFGASGGGPVRIPGVYNGKDRTFIFASYEGSREGVARSFVSTVPTELQRGGDFSQTQTRLTSGQAAAIVIYDPSTTHQSGAAWVRNPFPGNVIPTSRISPIAANLMKFYPLPTTDGNAITHTSNLPLAFKDPVSDDGYVFKVDHRFSDRHQAFFRGSWRRFSVVRKGGFKGIPTEDRDDRTSPGLAADDTIILNPTTVLNFRYGISRYPTEVKRADYGFDITTLGFPETLARAVDRPGIPSISVSGYTTFGGTAISNAVQETHSAHARVIKHFGRHSTRLGVDLRVGRDNTGPGGTTAGTYSFNNVFTRGPNPQAATQTGGHALASFLLGLGASGSMPYSASVAEQIPYYGFFFQDDVRVSPRLSVNFGLRYEWEGAHTERFDRFNRGFDLEAASPIELAAKANYAANPIPELPAAQFNVKGGLLFAGVGGQPRGLTDTDWNNISPRVGVAYTFGKNTVVRGGYGIFYGPTTSQRETSYGFSTSTTWVTSVDGSLTPRDTLSNPFPQGIALPPAASDGLMTQVGQAATYVDTKREQLFVYQYQVSIQRQLPGNVLAEAAYVASRGRDYPVTIPLSAIPLNHQLQARQTFLDTGRNVLNDSVKNPFYGLISTGTLSAATTVRGNLLRPYPHFTNLSRLDTTIGTTKYDSFQFKASKRFSQGLSFLLAYTNSKKIDQVSYQNATDTELTRQLSSYDIPQRVVVSGSYELPFGKNRALFAGAGGVLGKIVEGWQINWIYQAQSGIPLVVSSGESVGRSAKLPKSEQTRLRWLDTSAFRLRETLELVGTSTLPDVRSLGRNMMDFSLYKNTVIHEQVKVQFRAESFNLFNRTEFNTPNMTVGNANFGVITSQINFARQIQLGLRLLW